MRPTLLLAALLPLAACDGGRPDVPTASRCAVSDAHVVVGEAVTITARVQGADEAVIGLGDGTLGQGPVARNRFTTTYAYRAPGAYDIRVTPVPPPGGSWVGCNVGVEVLPAVGAGPPA